MLLLYCCGLTLSKERRGSENGLVLGGARTDKAMPSTWTPTPPSSDESDRYPPYLAPWGRTIAYANMHTHTFLARLLRHASLATCTIT